MRNQSRLRSFGRERQLRADATPAEKRMWHGLRALKTFHFRRQHRIGTLIVDFYCAEVKLAIEVDGSVHSGEEAETRDMERDRRLREFGVSVFHVRNSEVFVRLGEVVRQIEDLCLSL